MISYSKWTQEEHYRLVRLLGQGMKHREIARVMQRSENSITSRVCQTLRMSAPSSPVEHPKAYVELWEVPHWYEMGWRYLGRDETDFCIMEWRYSEMPRRPDVLALKPMRAA